MILSKHVLRDVMAAGFAQRPLCHLLCWRARRAVQKVSITFDDGPTEHATPRVLDVLRDEGVRCTFFVLGREVAKYPDIVKRIAAEGHEVGLHGYDHTGDNICGQIARCEAELRKLEVAPVPLFRPALGRRGMASLLQIRRRGYRTVLWSFDAFDSMRHEGKRTDKPDNGIIRAGDIILMHDDNPVCVEELPALIAGLRHRGLTPMTVTKLLEVH